MEDPYTNREIIEKFNYIKKSLVKIEGQTMNIDSRVARLEDKSNYARGVVKMATVSFIVVIVPILGWLLWTVAHLDDTILRVVTQAIAAHII